MTYEKCYAGTALKMNQYIIDECRKQSLILIKNSIKYCHIIAQSLIHNYCVWAQISFVFGYNEIVKFQTL